MGLLRTVREVRAEVRELGGDLSGLGRAPAQGGQITEARLARIEADQRRLRTMFEAPDPLLDPELMF